MRIEPCYFCGRPSYPSKGITFVRNDAKCFRFCRSKCHKNFKMKRQPRKLKWTKTHRMYAGKEMLVDTTVQFAARRNVPTRYSRELVAQTLQAMERISKIRARRERVFYKKRMAGKRAREVDENRKLVAQNEHLLRRLHSSEIHSIDMEESVLTRASQKSKVFGVEKQRLRTRIDGTVEMTTERTDNYNKMDMD